MNDGRYSYALLAIKYKCNGFPTKNNNHDKTNSIFSIHFSNWYIMF